MSEERRQTQRMLGAPMGMLPEWVAMTQPDEGRILENHRYNMDGLHEVIQGNAVATATFLGFHGT